MSATIKNKINWTNTLFLIFTPLIGIAGTVLLLVFSSIAWQTWVLGLVMLFACGLSITAGYHRLFSHRSYKTIWPVKLFYVLFGSAAFEGSIFEWSTDHRVHHRYTDTKKDPYSVIDGFWHAHIGWLIRLDTSKRDFSNIDDLTQSKLLRFQHKYFVLIGIVIGFGLPTAIASFWGQPLAGLIVAGFLRITIGHHGTFCINSLCHILGKRPYSKKQSARDSWVSAIFTFGEGYHNYHHQFPLDYRNGVRFWQYDPTKWLIKGLSYIGASSDLRQISKGRILQARIEARGKEMQLTEEHSALHQLYETMMLKVNELKTFEKLYANPVSRSKEIHIKIKQTSKEVKKMFASWKHLAHVPLAPGA